MTQLILDANGDAVTLPESIKDGYHAAKEPGYVSVEMITRRTVLEERGDIWVVRYQYGYFNEEMKNRVIAACEKGWKQPINCGFLPPDSNGALTYRDFFVTSFDYPKFMWSRQVSQEDGSYAPVPMYGDFYLELREVKPGD